MKPKITLKDIAKELGVSKSTVSRALNDSPEISDEMKEKVKAFAELYHYKPNVLAMKLRNKKTMVIGVIIPEIVHHFFSRVISGIEKIANENEYNVMICLSNESFDKEVLNVRTLANGSVDGLLISISKETLEKNDFSHFDEAINDGLPLVFFDRASDEIKCDQVIVDDIGGGYKATKHLIEEGCKRIAILTTPDYVSVGKLRMQGYVKALSENNLDLNKGYVVKVQENANFRDQILDFFEKTPVLPDGIVCVNEIYAATAIKIAKQKGLTVPDDIAVIGFTDGLISEFSSPSLSTVAQHGFTMGEQAAQLLLNRINNKNTEDIDYEKVIISTDIKKRDSTKKMQESML
jgi:LacI family transcriptional regulator